VPRPPTAAQARTPRRRPPPLPGVAFSRLTPDGALEENTAAVRITRRGRGAIDAPRAAGGYRRWGESAAADVLGSRVYLAVPYAPPQGSGGGAWIAVIDGA
jgi:hypothetical protein